VFTGVPAAFLHARLLASSRRQPEDRCEIIERGDALVIVVADGAGGMRGGAVASDALVHAICAAVVDDTFDIESGAGWSSVFRRSDTDLAAKMGGETTGILVVLTPRGLIGVSAGDSEAWMITETRIDDLTTSQSKLRLGSGRSTPTPFFRPALEGTLVVGTDGLFKYAGAERIAAVARHDDDATEVARKLGSLVQLPSGRYQDDVGVVVVRRRAASSSG
jgi:PPM family protein phosphatase